LGFIFYPFFEHKNEDKIVDGILYIPHAYVILSEYPYFYHYKEICRQVFRQTRMEHDEMPIEILLNTDNVLFAIEWISFYGY